MSIHYRRQEPYGPYRHDWDESEYDFEIHETDEYSKKPVTSSKSAGDSHHRECMYDQINIDTCMCFELHMRDYEADKERELEEMHVEWWT